MKNLALTYYQRGQGCSQCILKAAETKHKVQIDSKCYNMMGALNTGFGVGGMCSVVIACVMVLGLLFDEETAKQRRLLFLSEFQKKYGGTNCSHLITKRRGNRMCADLVLGTVEILDKIIEG